MDVLCFVTLKINKTQDKQSYCSIQNTFLCEPLRFIQHLSGFNRYRCECVEAGAGRDYRQRERLSQTHQDLGAVWGVHEDPGYE